MRIYHYAQVIFMTFILSMNVYAQSSVNKDTETTQTAQKGMKKSEVNKTQDNTSSIQQKSSDDQSKNEKPVESDKVVESSLEHNKLDESSKLETLVLKDEVSNNPDEIVAEQQTKHPFIRARSKGRLADRDSGFAPQNGSWSFGLFNPLKVQLSDSWGLESHPLVALLISPHMRLWHTWWEQGRMSLQGLYAFTTPSWSLQKGVPFGLAGYLSPSCKVLKEEPNRAPTSCQRPGFDIAPHIGARLSGEQGDGVWTIDADVAIGLMISGTRPAPLDTYAPVDLSYAPTTHKFRSHLGLRYAHLVHQKISMSIGADLYLTGQADEQIMPTKSPISMSTQINLDWALSQHLSLSLGTILWLSDQRAFELIEDEQGYVQKDSIMSLDVFPTFDLLWHY